MALTETAAWLIEAWFESLTRVLEALTGQRPEVSRRPPAGGAPPKQASSAEATLWWEQRLSLGADAVLWVGAPFDTWRGIGAQVLTAAGIEEVDPADAKSTFLEALGQSLSGLAQSVGSRLGREVACESGREIPAPPQTTATAEAELKLAGNPLPALVIALGEGLLQALAPADRECELAPAAPAAPGQTPSTLDLLMEVELPVSVSFGRAELLLKDVLKLTTGSIVELNRTVDQPVELIVNNCVIARGEVVAVEGNYGLRIQHIISPQERLRTLK